MDNSGLNGYILYLQLLQKKIDGFFEEQKEYIACEKGCSKCCRNAEFPFTEIEFRLLVQGLFRQNSDIQAQIMNNVEEIIQTKDEFKKSNPDEKFRYDCPCLIDNSCAVYNYRGLVCRTFGLMAFKNGSDEKSKIPFCAFEGLNYSKILDKETKMISEEKFKELNYKTEPKAFNIRYSNLIDDEVAEKMGFEFGEVKSIIDWFEEFGK